MLKILKAKIIFIDWKFKIILNNNVMKIKRAVCKEKLLYLQWYLQETDFLNGNVDNDSDGKVAESCSNDAGDDDDVGDGEGKRKVDCEGEADVDDDDNDSGGVDDDGGVDIYDGNDANGGDSISKADCDDDADGGCGNSNDDGSANGDGIFENWCFDGKGGDEADDGAEQTENVVGDLAQCNGNSKWKWQGE